MTAQQTRETTEGTSEGLDPQVGPAGPGTSSEVTEDPTEGATEGIDGQEGREEAAEEQEDADSGNREAAKYRRRLRETESERDGLQTQLTELRKQMAEQASGLAKPGALWAAGVELDDLFGEDGRLDSRKLNEAVTTATDQLGLATSRRTPHPGQGSDSNAGPDPKPSFADAFKSR